MRAHDAEKGKHWHAGETWAPLSFDTGLAGDTTQGSLHSSRDGAILYFSHPWNTLTDSHLNHSLHRSNLTVHRSTNGGERIFPNFCLTFCQH
jgi:hypothetical protein